MIKEEKKNEIKIEKLIKILKLILPIIIGLEWSAFGNAHVFFLFLGQYGQMCIETGQMKTGHVFV